MKRVQITIASVYLGKRTLRGKTDIIVDDETAIYLEKMKYGKIIEDVPIEEPNKKEPQQTEDETEVKPKRKKK